MIETIGHLKNAGMKPLFVLAYMPYLLKNVSGNKKFGARLLPATRFHISNRIDIIY
jgi:hypothetical protein